MLTATGFSLYYSIRDIEQFVIESGSDHIRTFGGEKEGGANSQQVPCEIAACIHKILSMGNPIKNYLEIGAAAGGSTYLINHFLQPENIVLIDDNRHPKAKLRGQILSGVQRQEFIGNSQAIPIIRDVYDIEMAYDLVFIDGDHSYRGSMADFTVYSTLVKPGGLIMFHDIAYEPAFGVKQTYSEVKEYPGWSEVGAFISESLPRCGIGLLRKMIK